MAAHLMIAGKLVTRREGARSWEAIELLGRGGQGVVYSARELTSEGDITDELVAAVRNASSSMVGPVDDRAPALAAALRKFLQSGLTEDFVIKVYAARPEQADEDAWRRFEQEARLLSERLHPNIIRLEDCGELETGERFIVMPRYRLGNLERNRSSYTGDPQSCLFAIIELLGAVCSLHAHGGVHRDIKPANILVKDDGHLVLADFGLVFDNQRFESVTNTGEHVGNWQFGPDWSYSAPGHSRSTLIDLYSMGKVLWWLASGMDILPRENWSKPAFNLEQLFPAVNGMRLLNNVFDKVLVADPSTVRYPDAAAMRADAISLLEELTTRRARATPAIHACLACQVGQYRRTHGVGLPDLEAWKEITNRQLQPGKDTFIVGIEGYRCDTCGHLVWYATHPPAA